MKVFLYCLVSFSVAWLIHLMIWRIALPKKHTRSLLIIFLFTLLTILIIEATTKIFPLTWIQTLHIMVFYIPTMLAYICFYSAIEEDSPSIGLITLTAKKKKCQLEDYYSVINDQLLIDSRLKAMVRDGLLNQADKHYQLTAKGMRMGQLFSMAHSLLQLRKAG